MPAASRLWVIASPPVGQYGVSIRFGVSITDSRRARLDIEGTYALYLRHSAVGSRFYVSAILPILRRVPRLGGRAACRCSAAAWSLRRRFIISMPPRCGADALMKKKKEACTGARPSPLLGSAGSSAR